MRQSAAAAPAARPHSSAPASACVTKYTCSEPHRDQRPPGGGARCGGRGVDPALRLQRAVARRGRRPVPRRRRGRGVRRARLKRRGDVFAALRARPARRARGPARLRRPRVPVPPRRVVGEEAAPIARSHGATTRPLACKAQKPFEGQGGRIAV